MKGSDRSLFQGYIRAFD